MEILISVGLLVVGVVIGFFIGQYQASQQSSGAANKAAEQSVKAVMTQQAEHHVFQTRQTLHSLKQQIEHLEDQIVDYETQIQPAEEDDGTPKMTFFGEQATAMLRNTQSNRVKTKTTSTDEQPRDFANSASGLFVDDKRQSNE